MNPIANIMASLPPILDVINQQTNIKLPSILGGDNKLN